MRIPRSFALTAAVVLSLAGFTACAKVHPESQPKEAVALAPPARAPGQAANKAAAEPARPNVPDLNPINLEVAALDTLHQFKMTRPQLERLAALAPATARKPSVPRPTKVSDEFQKTLRNLREALLDNNEVRITDLTLTLDELREKENPDFDEVEITDAARRHTAEVLRGLSARQVLGYLGDYADEFPDPREKLTDAFEQVRKLPAKEWEELRDEIAAQVGWLTAGLDAAAEGKIHDRAAELLNRVRRLGDGEYAAQRAELDKAARDIVGEVGPTEVIRHFTERSIAELLSNPRLSAAIAARLKKAE